MIISVFFGLFNTLNSWLKSLNLDWRTELTQSRKAETEKLVAKTDSNYFLTSKVLPLLKYICEKPDIDLIKIQQDYLAKYDLDLSIYLFDEKGKLEQVAPKKATNQWLMKNIFPYLLEKDIKKIEKGSKELDKKIEFSFGYGKCLLSIRDNPEIITNSVSSGEDCFYTWAKRAPKSVLIFGNRLPNPEIILKEAKSKIHKDKDFLYMGKISDEAKTEQEVEAFKVNNYFSSKSIEQGIYNNQEWYFSANKNGEKYYTTYKISSSIYSRGIIYLRYLFLIIIPLLLFIIIRFTINFNLNLKQMILLIFMASAMIPLGIISSESFENIETYSDIYINELKSSLEATLANCIQNFDNYITLCSNNLKQITSPKDDIYDFDEIEKRVIKDYPKTKFSIRDAACDIIYTNSPLYSSGQNTLYKAIGRSCIKKFNPDRFDELPYNGNEFIEEMISREDLGLSHLTNNPNRLQFLYNTGMRMLLFIKLLPKKAGRAAILYILLNIQNTMKEYIKNIDKRSLVLNQQQINLIAFNPNGYKWFIPPSSMNNQYLEQAEAAFITGKPIFRKIKDKGKTFYSLCISNSEYYEVCYLGFIPIDKLESEISRKKMIIVVCAVLSIILFIIMTTWIMSQLIKPLGDLEKGIIALEKRNFEVQIDVPQGKDEFVQLFKEFNFMMGENYDMQMAKNVQEGIITTLFPQADNYIISGNTYSIDKLNSNCLTSFKLPDGKILFLVGNITGTSIGSALMMAFIRSVTFHWSQKEQTNPVLLIEAIEQMFNSNKTKHMYIGLICGILDPTNGEIKLVVRGHIFPLFLRKDKSLEWIGKPTMPIGISKKAENLLIETQLLPSERMLCLTNGIIEINCNEEKTTVYKLIEKWAVETLDDNKQSWIDNIKTKFDEFCIANNAKQTEDITLFSIISDKKEGEQE